MTRTKTIDEKIIAQEKELKQFSKNNGFDSENVISAYHFRICEEANGRIRSVTTYTCDKAYNYIIRYYQGIINA